MWAYASQCAYLTMCGLVVTLTFDLSTSKSIQFICVSNCTEFVNLVKFPRADYKISCWEILVYDHGRTLGRTARKQNTSDTALTMAKA